MSIKLLLSSGIAASLATAPVAFGRDGDWIQFLFGQPPKLTQVSGREVEEDEDTSFRFGSFYQVRLTDEITVRPGMFAVTNLEHDESNNTIFVWTLRTIFEF
ncbi:carbohydrate porin [Leptolyngbya sp. FACHB-261]|uniref:carbohydrate porin n=1 Tax=Leptolyngbya sp. FACHB-261 TaxID=2692806 RepID=UPI00168261E6|nr:carbohydrate porin [Leptolyngbya sp. FACHB-261]MBD2100681.1 carbohydrate porin [Leptolyngbya sp. FACHB-261]